MDTMYVRDRIEDPRISWRLGRLAEVAASPSAAEVTRLKDEMRLRAAKNAWTGVERAYREWFALRPEEDWEVHALAAQAAGQLGDGGARYVRLRRALDASPPPQAVADLTASKDNLERGWTRVDIRLRARANGILQPTGGLPFAADQRSAIVRAQIDLKASGKFEGLLPAIPYSVDGHQIPLGDPATISRVSLVSIRQTSDGSFRLRTHPGPWNPLVRPGALRRQP
jgi:hypothetical protein